MLEQRGTRRRNPRSIYKGERDFEVRARETRGGAEPVAEQRGETVVATGARDVGRMGDVARHRREPEDPLPAVGEADARGARGAGQDGFVGRGGREVVCRRSGSPSRERRWRAESPRFCEGLLATTRASACSARDGDQRVHP